MKYSIRLFRKDKSVSEPVTIDAEKDLRRDPVTGRMVYKAPSAKTKFLLALQLLSGIVLGMGLFLILLPIAILLAVVVVIVLLLFLLLFWRRLYKMRAFFWDVHRRV